MSPSRTPQPSAADLRCWRDLVAAAAEAAKGPPSAACPGLNRATNAARRCVVPGILSKENLFVRLVRTSQRYLAETTAGRRDLQAALAALAVDCGADLEPPPPRRRADLDN